MQFTIFYEYEIIFCEKIKKNLVDWKRNVIFTVSQIIQNIKMENLSDFIISDSNKREDYEILIKKKKENNFIAYCPQLNKLIKGNSFEKVYYMLDLTIYEHIKSMYPDFEYTQISLSDKLGVDNINIKNSASSSIL